MKRPIRHGGLITCDVKGCTEKFLTYSVATLVRTQAVREGWALLPFAFYPTAGRKKIDACPACAAELRETRQINDLATSIIRHEKSLQLRLARENDRVVTKLARVSVRYARLALRLKRAVRLISQRAKRSVRLGSLELAANVVKHISTTEGFEEEQGLVQATG